MNIVPFIPAHLDDLEVHDYMGFIQSQLNEDYGNVLAQFPSYSAVSDGKVISCGGVVPTGVYRQVAWSLMGTDSGKYLTALTRAVRRFLDLNECKRTETHVRSDFEAGHRWAKMLGFINETPDGMRGWGDDGYDYCLYARING